MSSEPKVFGESYIAMVAAGEAGGALDKVLQRLADFLERQEEMRRSVSTALAYPGLMAVVGSGVMLFLLTFVVPKITGIFADTKATLPFLTVALLTVSNLVRSGWWLLLLLTVAALLTYRRLSLKESFLQRRRPVSGVSAAGGGAAADAGPGPFLTGAGTFAGERRAASAFP
jgi:Type II secretory pathway, component PulF